MMKKIFLSAFLAALLCVNARAQNNNRQTDPNSISMSERGVNYQLTCIGDKLPQLLVNGKEIAPERLNDYGTIVAKLQANLFARQRAAAQKHNADMEKQLNDIVGDLVACRIISSPAALVSFRIDHSGFVVNGQKQSFVLFSRFKSKYMVADDKVYSFNDK